MSLMLQAVTGIPLIHAGDNLGEIILHAIKAAQIDLCDGDILVIAQKIISKSEGRLVNLTTITPSDQAMQLSELTGKDARFVELVLRESACVMRTRLNTLIVEHKNGFVCANAGIDHSNVEGLWGNSEDWMLLLPKDADQSAELIRQYFAKHAGVNIGVLVIDTHGRAWRIGTVGAAIGVAGLPAVVDLRGQADLFGYHLQVTQVAAADELAAAASLVMGQASEGTPVIHVRGFPYPLRESSLCELIRPKELDMFR